MLQPRFQHFLPGKKVGNIGPYFWQVVVISWNTTIRLPSLFTQTCMQKNEKVKRSSLWHTTAFLYQLSQARNCCSFMINMLVSKDNSEIQTRPTIGKILLNGSPEDLANTPTVIKLIEIHTNPFSFHVKMLLHNAGSPGSTQNLQNNL